MSLWEYKEHIDRNLINSSSIVIEKCKYCGSKMDINDIESHWNVTPQEFIESFEDTKQYMSEEQGVPLYDLNLDSNTLDDESTRLLSCKVCGWWSIEKEVTMWAISHRQLWEARYGVSGVLKNLDYTSSNFPIQEIRSFLAAKYEHRFNINPRLFEEVVCSVYKSLGLNSYTTNYSNDRGIDVVIHGESNELIGIQVKRYKNNIQVEQIRAFLGAMIINNITKGIFICTSDFQSGCHKISQSYPIELVNGSKFYEALKEAQLKEEIPNPTSDPTSIPKLYQYSILHRNSL